MQTSKNSKRGAVNASSSNRQHNPVENTPRGSKRVKTQSSPPQDENRQMRLRNTPARQQRTSIVTETTPQRRVTDEGRQVTPISRPRDSQLQQADSQMRGEIVIDRVPRSPLRQNDSILSRGSSSLRRVNMPGTYMADEPPLIRNIDLDNEYAGPNGRNDNPVSSINLSQMLEIEAN